MARKEGETKEEYKERRQAERDKVKEKLKPKVFWDSSRLGTYRERNE